MRRLLTIEEAASYLSVSKSSLRRWTNDGRLPCVRVGVRRERRFRVEDLDDFVHRQEAQHEAFLPAQSATPRSGPIGYGQADATTDPIRAIEAAAARGVPRHVCLHYRDADELWRLFRPYVLHHLKRRAPIFYVHEDGGRHDIERRIRDQGWDPDELSGSGLLRLLVPAEAYLRTGDFAPGRMIDFMHSAILDRRADGHSTMLISGDMSWYLTGADGVEGMIPYEERLNELLRHYPDVTIVCHYDIGRLDAGVTLGALCAHPHVHLPDRLVPGYYGSGRALRS